MIFFNKDYVFESYYRNSHEVVKMITLLKLLRNTVLKLLR